MNEFGHKEEKNRKILFTSESVGEGHPGRNSGMVVRSHDFLD